MGKVCEIAPKSDKVIKLYRGKDEALGRYAMDAYINCEEESYWEEGWLCIEDSYNGHVESGISIDYHEAIALARFIMNEANLRGHTEVVVDECQVDGG